MATNFLSKLGSAISGTVNQLKEGAYQNLLKYTPTSYSAPAAVTPITKAQQEASHAAVAARKTGTTPAGTSVGGGGSLSSTASNALTDEIASIIADLEAQLDNIPGMILTEEEKNAFLEKAIAQVEPYYNTKKSEIEKGIQAGKIQTAEDVLLTIRDVRQETEDLLSKYNIAEAQTEEEFVNTMADITATEGENLETSRYNWTNRVKNVKMGQVEKGTLTSGIGQKEIGELLSRQQTEEQTIARQAEQARTETTTAQKYDLQNITNARETVERERVRMIGSPEQEAATTASALTTAGLPSLEALPSKAQIQLQRGLNPTTLYKPEALTDIEEQRKQAVESRKLALQQEELDIRAVRREAERQRAQLEAMKKYSYT